MYSHFHRRSHFLLAKWYTGALPLPVIAGHLDQQNKRVTYAMLHAPFMPLSIRLLLELGRHIKTELTVGPLHANVRVVCDAVRIAGRERLGCATRPLVHVEPRKCSVFVGPVTWSLGLCYEVRPLVGHCAGIESGFSLIHDCATPGVPPIHCANGQHKRQQ